MKQVLIIEDTGSSSDVFYKIDQFSTIFYGASGEMIVRLKKFSDDSIVEQVTTPVPGVFMDVLVTVSNVQRNERFYVTVSRSTGGSSTTQQSGATVFPDPGYSSALSVAVVAYP